MLLHALKNTEKLKYMYDWFEKEEQEIIDSFNQGLIDQKEFNKQMRELIQSQRDADEEAYQSELNILNERYGR